MKPELEQKLADEFPFMKRGSSVAEQKAEGFINDLYGAFGCDFGDGWYKVLRGLCIEITEAYKKRQMDIDFVPVQVKEKFGELRFYWTTIGSNHELYEELNSIVEKWENKSTTVCETCGEEGVLRKDLQWVLTLCDSCYLKVKNGGISTSSVKHDHDIETIITAFREIADE